MRIHNDGEDAIFDAVNTARQSKKAQSTPGKVLNQSRQLRRRMICYRTTSAGKSYKA